MGNEFMRLEGLRMMTVGRPLNGAKIERSEK